MKLDVDTTMDMTVLCILLNEKNNKAASELHAIWFRLYDSLDKVKLWLWKKDQ